MAEASDIKNGKPESSHEKRKAARQIPGNLPYTSSLGVFKRALEKIIEGEKPTIFTRDFLGTVLGITGGAANPVIPILKKTGFLTDGGAPTDIYSDFQSNSARSNAALQALRRGFSEIFRKNQYAHKADRNKLVDLIRSITGLPTGDPVIGYIYGTFNAFQDYAKGASEIAEPISDDSEISELNPGILSQPTMLSNQSNMASIGLSYQINIILPETANIEVFNSIFKSLRENLLK